MVAAVEIQFFERPTDNEIHFMRLAAQKLTKDPFTVEISKFDDLPNIATAIFRMKNEAQYKVVDRVALTFKRLIPFYNHITIWFEQGKSLRPSELQGHALTKMKLSPTRRLTRR